MEYDEIDYTMEWQAFFRAISDYQIETQEDWWISDRLGIEDISNKESCESSSGKIRGRA